MKDIFTNLEEMEEKKATIGSSHVWPNLHGWPGANLLACLADIFIPSSGKLPLKIAQGETTSLLTVSLWLPLLILDWIWFCRGWGDWKAQLGPQDLLDQGWVQEQCGSVWNLFLRRRLGLLLACYHPGVSGQTLFLGVHKGISSHTLQKSTFSVTFSQLLMK